MSLWIKSYFVIVIYEVAFKSKETSKQWLPKREKNKQKHTNKQPNNQKTNTQTSKHQNCDSKKRENMIG